jgi:hypothetical protein
MCQVKQTTLSNIQNDTGSESVKSYQKDFFVAEGAPEEHSDTGKCRLIRCEILTDKLLGHVSPCP